MIVTDVNEKLAELQGTDGTNNVHLYYILISELNYAYTVEPVYYGHLGTNQRCPDYQGVLIFQVSLFDKAPFRTIARCPDYAGVHIFKCPD